MSGEFYDADEAQDAGQREARLLAALPDFIAMAQTESPGWARQLRDVDATAVTSREALARLPLLRKSDLPALQRGDPPFAGFVTRRPLKRIMVSPGPILEPQPAGPDPWRMARALYAAGL